MSEPFNLQKLLQDVFDPRSDEKGLVLVDIPESEEQDHTDWQERRDMAAEWCHALSEFGVDMPSVVTFTATGSPNSDLPDVAQCNGNEISLPEKIAAANLVVAMTQYSATAPLARLLRHNPGLRVASMPGVLRRMEQSALAADYAEIARRVAILRELADHATLATLTFASKHEVQFDLRFRHAHGDDGHCRRDSPFPLINLPSGEAFIVPYEGEKEGEASLTSGEIPVQEDGRTLVYRVEANHIVDVSGDVELATDRKTWFEADAARANVAELGLGCNPSAVVKGNVLEDEKAGIHWAYGRSEHLGGVTGPDAFLSPSNVVHLDIVYAPGCPMEADTLTLTFPNGTTQTILENNRWTVFG